MVIVLFFFGIFCLVGFILILVALGIVFWGFIQGVGDAAKYWWTRLRYRLK